jgi:hypothetical protein
MGMKQRRKEQKGAKKKIQYKGDRGTAGDRERNWPIVTAIAIWEKRSFRFMGLLLPPSVKVASVIAILERR